MLKKKMIAAVCSVAMIFSNIAFAAPVVKDNAQNITSSNVKLFANEGAFGDNLTWSINNQEKTGAEIVNVSTNVINSEYTTTAVIQCYESNLNGSIIYADYDNYNVLNSLYVKDLTLSEGISEYNFTSTANIRSIKVMLWDSLIGITPLSNSSGLSLMSSTSEDEKIEVSYTERDNTGEITVNSNITFDNNTQQTLLAFKGESLNDVTNQNIIAINQTMNINTIPVRKLNSVADEGKYTVLIGGYKNGVFNIYSDSFMIGNSSVTPIPTVEPTAEPTATPTVKPTTEPTVTPTVEPTTEPTATPTAEPTIDTTPTPTAEPTPTPKPTPLPVANSTLKIKGSVRNGNTISGIKITGETDSPSAIGIVAVYDYQGKLKGMSKTKSELLVEAGTYDLSQPIAYDDTDTYKIFVWNGISEIALQPLAKAYVKPEYEYSIATVGKVKDLQEMTVSNNGDIYYRTDTSRIYKMNAETGTSTVFLDTSSMRYQLDNISYSDFMILSIAYNNYSDKLYMFGRYTTKDFTNEKGSCAIYEITDGNAGEPIYFDKGTSQVPTSDNYYFKHIDFLNADEMYLELYRNTYIMDLNDYSTIDVNSNTGRYGYIFYGDGDLYSFNTYTAGLYFVGSYTSPKNNQLKSIASWQKATSDNYSLGGNYPSTNHKGYTVYNEKPYYAGRPEDNSKPTGDIYYMDLEGSISRFINAYDVEQRGNNTVDISCLDFFTMDYEGLPMWYDSDLGVIKRYVRN